MRINFDRLSKLAGLPASGNRRGLYENADHSMKEMGDGTDADEGMRPKHAMEEDDAFDPSQFLEEADDDGNQREGMGDGGLQREEADDGDGGMNELDEMDEMIEVDEVMLVQELRRAKRIMNENKRRRMNESRRNSRRKQNIFEAQLKQVIDEEVQNVMEEMNLTSQWVYGERRPTRSRKGHTHQGSMLPGIGFRRRR